MWAALVLVVGVVAKYVLCVCIISFHKGFVSSISLSTVFLKPIILLYENLLCKFCCHTEFPGVRELCFASSCSS